MASGNSKRADFNCVINDIHTKALVGSKTWWLSMSKYVPKVASDT